MRPRSTNKSNLFQMNTPARGARGVTEEDIRTVLPAGCSVEGRLVCAGPTRVDGSVTGELVADSLLVVDRNSKVVANLNVRELIVRGRVTGDILATARITLDESAVVEGDIETPGITIAEGAEVRGKIDVRRDGPNPGTLDRPAESEIA